MSTILKKNEFYWIILILFSLMSCASPKKPKPEPVLTIEDEMRNRDSFAVEINFVPGKPELSDIAKNKLTAVFDHLENGGKIEEVKVVSWGDIEYPSIHTKKVSDEQIDLVTERNTRILNFLDEKDKNLTKQMFNMADRKAALNRYLAGVDEKTKRSLESTGIPNTDETVKVPGKASKSIVIFIMEE